jgi:hypothetical protein
MTQSNGSTALAVPALSDKQLRTRLQVARQPGFGLDGATGEQLHLIYQLCQRYRLDPLLHITLFRDKPFTTIDGRIELAKRHPEYRGFRTRPLNKDEKAAWDYRPDDLVVECTITTKSWGDITSRGKVSALERQKNSPLGTNPQEMAEKRAIARASRLAFGQSAYLDEDDLEQDPRDDPEQQARLAQRYTEIFRDEEDEPPTAPHTSGQPNQGASAPVGAPDAQQAAQIVDKARAAAHQRELDLAEIDRQRREEGLI